MLRAFSLSLAGHAALFLSFLLLSGVARQPVRIVDAVRPVRLIASLELPSRPAAAVRTEGPAEPAPLRVTAPARPVQPEAEPVPTTAPAAGAIPPPPLTVPKIMIPSREASPPAPRPDLKTRLSQRLASVTTIETKTPEVAAPRLATLPPAAVTAPPEIVRTAAPAPRPESPGAGPVVPLSNFPYAWYLAILKEKVFSNWETPSEFALERKTVSAQVAFRLQRSGILSRVTLKESSGYRRFDQSALAAVQSLKDVPLLPEDYREEYLDVVIRFQNTK